MQYTRSNAFSKAWASIFKVYFHWRKGHADIEFNEIADNLAGKANVISGAGDGLSYHNRNDLILNGKLLNHDYVDEPMAIDNG